MEIRKSEPSEYIDIQKTYRKFDYKWKINPQDYVLLAKDKDKIIGTLRISEEKGSMVLSGLFVERAYKRRGIEIEMLRKLEQQLKGKELYCIPYVHQKGFFKQFGYEMVEINKAPTFVRKLLFSKMRFERYSEKNGILIIMKKHKPG